MKHRGFSLIELLVVIGIIGLLAAIVFAAANTSRDTARSTVTQQRMEQVLSGLRVYASENQAMTLQRGILGLSTVQTGWNGNNGGNYGFTSAATFSVTNATSATNNATVGQAFGSNSNFQTVNINMKDFNPLKTFEFLSVAGVGTDSSLPSPNASDPSLSDATRQIDVARMKIGRSQKSAWNDGWGNPLIVGYGLYVAENQAKAAIDYNTYKYSRCLYISVGSVGSNRSVAFGTGQWTLPFSPSSTATLQKGWDVITAVCNSSTNDGLGTWLWATTAAYKNAPWQGIKQARGKGSYAGSLCLLSAVEEFR